MVFLFQLSTLMCKTKKQTDFNMDKLEPNFHRSAKRLWLTIIQSHRFLKLLTDFIFKLNMLYMTNRGKFKLHFKCKYTFAAKHKRHMKTVAYLNFIKEHKYFNMLEFRFI